MSDAPIFIIGAARSGTKFLRDCLRADTRIAAVPYDINYIWRFGQPKCSDDQLSPLTLSPAQIRFIRRTTEGQARLAPGQILLEKSVSNSLRVPFVDAIFPGARYVHLVRDGRDVALSAIKQWSAPPDYRRLVEKLRRIPISSLPYVAWYIRNSILGRRKQSGSHVNVWGPRYPGIRADVASRTLAEVCALQWQHSVETARTDLAMLPQDSVFTVKYENLVSDRSVIAELAAGLCLDGNSIVNKWDATVVPKHNNVLDPSEATTMSEIEAVIATTLSSFGY
ncbi:MAG: sulfotransferase [Pseudomonadota bacterium]